LNLGAIDAWQGENLVRRFLEQRKEFKL